MDRNEIDEGTKGAAQRVRDTEGLHDGRHILVQECWLVIRSVRVY